jgi:hypothetical protein
MGGSPTSCLNFAEKAERDTLRWLESFSTVHGSSGWRWRSTSARPIWGSFNAPNQLAFPKLPASMQARTAWMKRISDKRVMTVSAAALFALASDFTTFTMAGSHAFGCSRWLLI